MIRGVVFDLDGTLLNTIDTITYYGNMALRHFGLPETTPEKYKYFVGNGAKVLVQRMLMDCGQYSEALYTKVYQYYMAAYDDSPLYLTTPYAGMVETVQALKERGLKLAVLSNKPHSAVAPIVPIFFGEAFDAVQGAVEGRKTKPDPAGVFAILEQLSLRQEETLYIGDTWIDMDTGKAAGLYTMGCLWGFRTREELVSHHADRLLQEPADILRYVEEVNGGTT